MIIQTKDFAHALERVGRLEIKRTTLPILTSVRLEAKNGTLEVYATDLDSYGIASCECQGDLAPVCVNAKLITSLVQNGGEVTTVTMVKERLCVEGNGRALLPVVTPVDEFPKFPTGMTAIGLPVDELASAIKGVAWAADMKKMTDRVCCACVHVLTKPKMLRVTATDGRKGALLENPLICATTEFMFPCSEASFICEALLGEDATLLVSESFVGVKSKTLSVATKQPEGDYWPEKSIDAVMKQCESVIGNINVAGLKAALDMVAMVSASDLYSHAILRPSPRGIEVSYAGRTNGIEFETTVENTKCDFDPVKFDANIAREILRHAGDADETVKVVTGTNSIHFHYGNYISTLILMKL